MTSTHLTRALLLLAASTALTTAPAAAQTTDTDFHGYLAVGGATLPEYEGADAQQVIPFIAGRAAWGERYIAIEGVSARANILNSSSWEFGPLASITFGRDADVESAPVARLTPLDDAFEVGAFVAKRWDGVVRSGDTVRMEVRAVSDVSDVYDGWQSSVSTSYATPVGTRWRLGGDISATLVSDDYAATYFSVSAADSTASGLAPISAEGGLKDIGASVNATYALNDRWSITSFVGYKRLLGDAADSPIVRGEGSADQLSAGLGLGMSF